MRQKAQSFSVVFFSVSLLVYQSLAFAVEGKVEGKTENGVAVKISPVSQLWKDRSWKIDATLESWISEKMLPAIVTEQDVSVGCFSFKEDDLYMGFSQVWKIHAPFSKVEAGFDKFQDYPRFTADLVKAKAEKQSSELLASEEERYLVQFEQRVPVFFIPNVRYTLLYRLAKDGEKKLYRYSLTESNGLRYDDGFIYIKSLNDHETLVSEIDFFWGEWGAMSLVGKDKLWKDTLTAYVSSDFGIRFFIENPEWESKKIFNESEGRAKNMASVIEKCVQAKKLWIP